MLVSCVHFDMDWLQQLFKNIIYRPKPSDLQSLSIFSVTFLCKTWNLVFLNILASPSSHTCLQMRSSDDELILLKCKKWQSVPSCIPLASICVICSSGLHEVFLCVGLTVMSVDLEVMCNHFDNQSFLWIVIYRCRTLHVHGCWVRMRASVLKLRPPGSFWPQGSRRVPVQTCSNSYF